MNYMLFRTTRETRAYGAGLVEVDKFYGTTPEPLSDPEQHEWRTADVKLPESMLFGRSFPNAPVIVSKRTNNIIFVVLPADNSEGFYRPVDS